MQDTQQLQQQLEQEILAEWSRDAQVVDYNSKPAAPKGDDGFWKVVDEGRSREQHAKELEAMLQDPGVLDEVSKRDPRLYAEVRDRRIDAAIDAFNQMHPDYVKCQRNFREMLKALNAEYLQRSGDLSEDEMMDALYDAGVWTAEILSKTFKRLKRQGRLEMPEGMTRALTQQEKLYCTALVRTGKVTDALDYHVASSFDGDLPRNFTMDRYPVPSANAVWFVFSSLHAADLSPADLAEFRKYASRIPLPTVALLQDALNAWLVNRPDTREVQPQTPVAEVAPTRQELDKLSTEEIDEMVKATHQEMRRSR